MFLTLRAKSACTKQNVETYTLHSVKMKPAMPNNAIEASEHHVEVKRGNRLESLLCSPIRSVIY